MSEIVDPVEIFRIEARELFEQLESTLLDIETLPDDKELIDTAFRALHTIKGSGAMFGFEAASAFTHHVENVFDMLRKGKLKASQRLIEISLAAADHIRTLIENPDQASAVGGNVILTQLSELIDAGPPLAARLPDKAPSPQEGRRKTYRVKFRLAEGALTCGANPLLLLREMAELGDLTTSIIADRLPPIEAIDPTACYLQWECVLSTDRSRSVIEDVFMFVIDDTELAIEEIEPQAKRLGEILVEHRAVVPDQINKILEDQPRLGDLLVKVGDVSKDRIAGALAEQAHLRSEATRVAKREDGGVRVAAERLDQLMDQVGELVIAQARLRQLAGAGQDAQLLSLVEEIERLAAQLRDTTMGIRMVPIGSLFGRFRRLVRDLSQELGKEIELSTSGEDTELDKTVIERLHDPMVHLIRNSLDHGIGLPEDRVAQGKTRHGTIHLSAVHAGAQVLIKIKDDGRGIDAARVRAKAEENGLIPPGADLTDSELFQLIFQPGFSTASSVTNLSGRGVGMDVVKRAIEGLRGSIDIASEPGAGTEMTLRLPLTLAIIDGLLIRVGAARYVIPLSAVEECVELSEQDEARNTGRDFLNIRNAVVPFLRLRHLFKVTEPADPHQKVVIISTAESRVGLAVDQIIGKHQTVIKSLSKIHDGIPAFSGATILGDGSVALILDVTRLIGLAPTNDGLKKAS